MRFISRIIEGSFCLNQKTLRAYWIRLRGSFQRKSKWPQTKTQLKSFNMKYLSYRYLKYSGWNEKGWWAQVTPISKCFLRAIFRPTFRFQYLVLLWKAGTCCSASARQKTAEKPCNKSRVSDITKHLFWLVLYSGLHRYTLKNLVDKIALGVKIHS